MLAMTAEELEETIRKLREFAVAQEMQWVLDEVNEAIALGVPETRTLRQTSQQGLISYEDVTSTDGLPFPDQSQSRRSRRSEEFIRSRPMTQLEQGRLLLESLRRVLVDLDTVAVGSLDALNLARLSEDMDPDVKASFPDLTAPYAESISFAPDEGSTAPGISIDLIRNSERRTRVAELLSEIEAEIDS
jgi:hypothetical protein